MPQVDFLHDFVHIYWPSVRAVAAGEAPAPGYLAGPFLLVELWFFGLFPLAVAKWLWFASSLLEVAALAFFGARVLALSRDDSTRSVRAYGLLLLSSVPVVDSLLYGQLGVLAALGVTIALFALHERGATARERDTMAGVFVGIAVAAKPTWLLWLLLLPALRRWRAAAIALGTVLLAHASAFLLFGFDAVWRCSALCVERIAELRATIHTAPDSQHVAHVAQRWLHALSGSAPEDALARLAWLGPLSQLLGVAVAATLVLRGARSWSRACLAILVASACLVQTSWPLDFCMLPLLIASALPRGAWSRRALALPALAALLSSALLRGVPALRSDTAGACLAATLALALHAYLTRTRPAPLLREARTRPPAGA